MKSQSFTFHFKASPIAVYQAFIDPDLLKRWRAPDGMRMVVHQFEPMEGGRFRISLIYDDSGTQGKSSEQTDTYQGFFMTLVPGQTIVEIMSFESENPDMSREMTIRTHLYPEANGTKMIATHENLPEELSLKDNEAGWRMSLEKLASLVERDRDASAPGTRGLVTKVSRSEI